MEISGDVADARRADGRTDERRTREDRATQPMDAGWLSFAKSFHILDLKRFCGERQAAPKVGRTIIVEYSPFL